MDLAVFQPAEQAVLLCALRTAAAGSGPISPRAQAFLETMRNIVGHRGPICPHGPITPEEAAAEIQGAHQRKRLLQLASVAAMVERPVRPESAAFVKKLSDALGVRDPAVPVVDALSRGRKVRARLLTMRRMFRVAFKEAYLAEGIPGILRFFGAMFLKVTVNKDRLGSYKRLGLLPDGTLGREFWKHITKLGFGFPGELGGIPQSLAYHDVGHVLTGYSTQPEGEIQQGGFQASNRREDGFVFLQFVLLQFHQGVRCTPIAKAEVDLFDPAKVMGAVHRGSRVNVDLTHQWDFWDLMDLRLDEARARLHVAPAPAAVRIVDSRAA